MMMYHIESISLVGRKRIVRVALRGRMHIKQMYVYVWDIYGEGMSIACFVGCIVLIMNLSTRYFVGVVIGQRDGVFIEGWVVENDENLE